MFEKYQFKKFINLSLKDLGFEKPTEIQDLIIPLALKNKNIIGKSATGTGKTHAFILPILEKINTEKQEVQAVIISPTRELASQIYNDFNHFKQYDENLDMRLFVGGTDRNEEIKRLEKSQPHIVIGTLGKIKDLAVDENVLKIYTATTIVIDEADMVFEETELILIDNVFSLFENNIQVLTFSATIPEKIIHFLNKYIKTFELCDITNKAISKESIEHVFIPTKNKNKNDLLLKLLKTFTPYLAIIFANTRVKVDEIAKFLGANGFEIAKFTGELKPRERKQILKRIKNGEIQYLVASDIVARGLDIEGVTHIINYELPDDIEFYIHRTGRTARHDFDGVAISFYDYDDDNYLNKLESKGLTCKYKAFKDGQLVDTKERNHYRKRQSKISEMEEYLHKKIPVPKKVKPGYRKKRKEKINKELRKMKRKHIDDLYHRKGNKK